MRRTWKVDDMVVHQIVEDQNAYDTVEEFMPALDATRLEENLDWFSKDGFDSESRSIVLSYHSFVVQTPTHRVLIDSCIGNHKTLPIRPAWNNKSDSRWMNAFEETGLRREDIDYVLCTHLHLDHVGWNTRLNGGKWEATFPKARYLMVDTEYDCTRNWRKLHDTHDAQMAQIFEASFAESVAPIVEGGRADFVSATHVLNEYFRFLPTPGHTPGHVAVIIGRGVDWAVFTGDLIHSPIQARYPDILMFTDDDPQRAVITRRAFLEQFADTKTLVFTMHFPAPSVGYLRRWHDGYRLEYLPP